MTISVVTIVWNNAAFVDTFVDSLNAGLGEEPVELIVVCNGGPEVGASDSVLAKFDDARATVRYVRLAENRGFAGGMNAGTEVASGQVVVCANLDTSFGPGFFTLVSDRGSWDVLVPAVYGWEESFSDPPRRGPKRLNWRNAHRPYMPPGRGRRPCAGGQGCCVIVAKALHDERQRQVGGLFRPEYFAFAEDQELFWWAERSSQRVLFDPELRVRHAGAGSFDGRRTLESRPGWIQENVLCNHRLNHRLYGKGARGALGAVLDECILAARVLRRGPVAGWRVYRNSWRLYRGRIASIRGRTSDAVQRGRT